MTNTNQRSTNKHRLANSLFVKKDKLSN